MKNLKTSLTLLFIASLLASCTNDNPIESSDEAQDEMTLNKRIIYHTQSQFPTSNIKEVEYYSNNEIVADTVFNHLNQWTARKITITNGTTKTYQTLNTNNEIIEHREVTYDNQGRITSRRTYVPNNLIIVSFVYNPDNTVTANATNYQDGTVFQIATYHKNNSGLIYKEFKNNTLGNSGVFEGTLQFDGEKPTSLTFVDSPTVTTFDYYTNPMPSNLLKSVDELNNNVLSGLTLTRLAESGNFYYKRNGGSSSNGTTTYQTDFNTSNYIEYTKSTYLGGGSTNQLTTETFYYYN